MTKVTKKAASKKADKPADTAAPAAASANYVDIKTVYDTQLAKKVAEEFDIKNVFQVPKLKKVVLNMGLGGNLDKKDYEAARELLTLIAGQKAVTTRVRKSVAGFKIRQGWPIGCKVTLRRKQMYRFVERLIYMAMPKIRDFRGLSTSSFDGFANYSMGISDCTVFPGVDPEQVSINHGLDITFVFSQNNKDHVFSLMKLLNFPFKKDESNV